MQLADQPEARSVVPPLGAQLSAWLKGCAKRECETLRAGAIVRWNRAGSDSQAKVWTETLGWVIADLDLLNDTTEQDFLSIGGKLAKFIGWRSPRWHSLSL